MSRDFASPREIVVASDLTDTDILLPHAIAQARTGAKVTIVHAIGNASIGTPARMFGSGEDEMSIAQRILGQMANSLKSEGIDCSVIARAGLAAAVVCEEIRRMGASRLIIGTHGHGRAGQAIIGSVANVLLLTADTPVFIVGPDAANQEEHARPRRILHPIALSDRSQQSVELASEIAACYQAELTLLHLINPTAASGFYADEIAARDRRELGGLRSSSIPRTNVVVRYGEVVAEILSTAATDDSDWIIMGYSHDFPWWSMQNNYAYQVIAE